MGGSALNYFYLGILFISLALIEFLAGGASLLFSLPSYGLLCLLALLSLISFRHRQVPANLFCLGAGALFFGYILTRILTSPVEYLTRHDLFEVLGALIVYLLMTAHLTSPKHRLWLLLGLLLLGLVNVGIGTLQYFRKEHLAILSFTRSTEDYGPRATGFYGCPDHLAGFLEVVGLLGLSAACWGRWPNWLKILAGYCSLMCLVGVALTGSRGGCLSAAFGFLVFLGLSFLVIRQGMLGRRWVAVGGTLFAVALLAGGLAYFLSTQMNWRLRWVNFVEKGGDRLGMWAAAVKQFKLSPLTGTGSGTYLIYQREFRSSAEWGDAIYAHNDYLHLLAEYGLLGLAGILALLGAHLGRGLKLFNWFIAERLNSLGRIRSDTLALNIGALSALATYLVHSVFDFNLHIPANALVVAVVFGILANPGVQTPFPTDHHEWPNRCLRLALPALGIWLAWAGLPTLPGEFYAKQARAAVTAERFPEGVKLAQAGIAREKTNPYLYLYLGEALFGMSQSAPAGMATEVLLESGVDAYRKGLALFPQDRYLLLGIGWCLDGLHRFEEAEPFFKTLIAQEPDSFQIHAHYATHLHTAGKWDEAEAEYNLSMKLYPSLAAVKGLERLAKDRKENPKR